MRKILVFLFGFCLFGVAEAGSDADLDLRKILDAEWQYQMVEYPEWATWVGFPGQNGRWSDNSRAGIARHKAHVKDFLKQLKTIERTKLSSKEQLNYDLALRQTQEGLEGQKFPSELLPINQMGGPHQNIAQLLSMQPSTSVSELRDILSRLKGIPTVLNQTIALMKEGLKQNVTPPKVTLRDVAVQIEAQIVDDPTMSPMLETFNNLSASITVAEQKQLKEQAHKIYLAEVAPALRKLHHFFVETYLPNTTEVIGLSARSNGKEWYAHNVRVRTTTGLTPAEIHAIGKAEVKRIRLEMDGIIKNLDFKGDFAEFTEFLRSDARFFHTDEESLLTDYRDIAKRADPELTRLFGKLPRLTYGVKPIPSYAEKSQTTAHYSQGSPEAGRAGVFYANTYDLKSRPKWEMEALTLHESVPGHHLQIALAQELPDVPEFRKGSNYTAFVEGWGLYSESLGEEMGFYKDPYSKFGQLTYEMWRAVRLVVDTGMHSMGWTRQQAIDFFRANSSKADHDIEVEIDRYIVWPGQALAYKIGELRIKDLRAKATAALGPKFDIREFHDELLGNGALPLDILEERMSRWMKLKAVN